MRSLRIVRSWRRTTTTGRHRIASADKNWRWSAARRKRIYSNLFKIHWILYILIYIYISHFLYIFHFFHLFHLIHMLDSLVEVLSKKVWGAHLVHHVQDRIPGRCAGLQGRALLRASWQQAGRIQRVSGSSTTWSRTWNALSSASLGFTSGSSLSEGYELDYCAREKLSESLFLLFFHAFLGSERDGFVGGRGWDAHTHHPTPGHDVNVMPKTCRWCGKGPSAPGGALKNQFDLRFSFSFFCFLSRILHLFAFFFLKLEMSSWKVALRLRWLAALHGGVLRGLRRGRKMPQLIVIWLHFAAFKTS